MDALHVHRYTTLANNDGSFTQNAVSSFHDITDLEREVVSCADLTPVERLQREHSLFNQCQLRTFIERTIARTLDNPCTFTEKLLNAFKKSPFRSYLCCQCVSSLTSGTCMEAYQ